MMKVSRILGMITTLTAVMGLVICVLVGVQVWRLKTQAAARLDSVLTTLEDVVSLTSEGLDSAKTTLQQSQSLAANLAATLDTTSASVESAIPMLDILTRVTTIDLPETIQTTRTALETAQGAAGVIDSTLAFLRAIPLLGIAQGGSQDPLAESLQEVSTSLEPIPASLKSLEPSMSTAQENLAGLPGLLTAISTDADGISTTLLSAGTTISHLEEKLTTLADNLDNLHNTLPRTLNRTAWFITIILLWGVMTQAILLLQGLHMLGITIFAGDTGADNG
jgi:hypothetical protein